MKLTFGGCNRIAFQGCRLHWSDSFLMAQLKQSWQYWHSCTGESLWRTLLTIFQQKPLPDSILVQFHSFVSSRWGPSTSSESESFLSCLSFLFDLFRFRLCFGLLWTSPNTVRRKRGFQFVKWASHSNLLSFHENHIMCETMDPNRCIEGDGRGEG